jgi:hypothetical protein
MVFYFLDLSTTIFFASSSTRSSHRARDEKTAPFQNPLAAFRGFQVFFFFLQSHQCTTQTSVCVCVCDIVNSSKLSLASTAWWIGSKTSRVIWFDGKLQSRRRRRWESISVFIFIWQKKENGVEEEKTHWTEIRFHVSCLITSTKLFFTALFPSSRLRTSLSNLLTLFNWIFVY